MTTARGHLGTRNPEASNARFPTRINLYELSPGNHWRKLSHGREVAAWVQQATALLCAARKVDLARKILLSIQLTVVARVEQAIPRRLHYEYES